MALSEHEKKILSELEYSLFAQDPKFDENLSGKRIFARTRRVVRWGVTGFTVGSIFLVAFFTFSIIFSLLGLAVMFTSSIAVLKSLSALKRMRNTRSDHPSVSVG